MYAITNAPEAYDYSYVSTVAQVTDKQDREWRLVHVSDEMRWENYQTPRYSSGLYQAFKLDNTDSEHLDRFDKAANGRMRREMMKHWAEVQYQERIKALTFEDKLALYREGSYKFPPPDVAGTWSEKTWVRYIDREGRWML
jgi:hypothetical protein